MSQQGANCLKHRVQDAISRNPHLTRRDLHFEASEGHVVLRGNVPSYYQKQMAQESVRKVEGIVTIDNCLEVVDCLLPNAIG